MQKSNNNAVVLNSVGLDSAGRYECEVSAEAPSFKTVTKSGHMIVGS